MAGGFGLLAWKRASPTPPAPRPGRRDDAARQPQRPLRQGAAGRGGAARGLATWLASPSRPQPPPSLPRSLSAAAAWAGRARGRLRHTLPHTHSHIPARTHPRACISCSFPGRHSGAHESLLARPPGRDPCTQAQGPPLASRRFSPPGSSRPRSQPPGPDPFAAAAAAAAGTWKQQEAPDQHTLTVRTRSYH